MYPSQLTLSSVAGDAASVGRLGGKSGNTDFLAGRPLVVHLDLLCISVLLLTTPDPSLTRCLTDATFFKRSKLSGPKL